MEIRPADAVERAELAAFLRSTWHTDSVVAHGERIDLAGQEGFVAVHDGRIGGHVSYRVDGESCEITAIAVRPQRQGIGSRLMDAALHTARDAGCTRAWLTTTNDNLDALRFYQRRGFRMVELRAGAVDATRRPEAGAAGDRLVRHPDARRDRSRTRPLGGRIWRRGGLSSVTDDGRLRVPVPIGILATA
jgi:ribosomal protein S18 acetylase RimI-like enzyme